MEKPTWEALSSKLGDLLRYDTLESLVRAAESDNEVGYIEAQFFGGVELADITQVLFYDEEIPDTIRLLLEKRRLPWHMVK